MITKKLKIAAGKSEHMQQFYIKNKVRKHEALGSTSLLLTNHGLKQ